MAIDPADLQPAIDALTQAANNLDAANQVRQGQIDADTADIAARQAQIDADKADIVTQSAAQSLDVQGAAAIRTAIDALNNLVNPPDNPTP